MNGTIYRATDLKRVLKHQGRYQRWLAQRLGVSDEMISHMIAGRRAFSEEEARRTSELLGVPMDALFQFWYLNPDGSAGSRSWRKRATNMGGERDGASA